MHCPIEIYFIDRSSSAHIRYEPLILLVEFESLVLSHHRSFSVKASSTQSLFDMTCQRARTELASTQPLSEYCQIVLGAKFDSKDDDPYIAKKNLRHNARYVLGMVCWTLCNFLDVFVYWNRTVLLKNV